MGEVADKVRASFASIRASNVELISIAKDGISRHLDVIGLTGRFEGLYLALCCFSTLSGVAKAAEGGSPSSVVLQFAIATIAIAAQWFNQQIMGSVVHRTLAAVDRHAGYVADRSMSDIQLYAGASMAMSQNPDRVLFVASDGTRYLVKEMVNHVVNMTPVGKEYITTVATIGSCQDGEYNCVDFDFFEPNNAETEAPATTPPGPDSLPN